MTPTEEQIQKQAAELVDRLCSNSRWDLSNPVDYERFCIFRRNEIRLTATALRSAYNAGVGLCIEHFNTCIQNGNEMLRDQGPDVDLEIELSILTQYSETLEALKLPEPQPTQPVEDKK